MKRPYRDVLLDWTFVNNRVPYMIEDLELHQLSSEEYIRRHVLPRNLQGCRLVISLISSYLSVGTFVHVAAPNIETVRNSCFVQFCLSRRIPVPTSLTGCMIHVPSGTSVPTGELVVPCSAQVHVPIGRTYYTRIGRIGLDLPPPPSIHFRGMVMVVHGNMVPFVHLDPIGRHLILTTPGCEKTWQRTHPYADIRTAVPDQGVEWDSILVDRIFRNKTYFTMTDTQCTGRVDRFVRDVSQLSCKRMLVILDGTPSEPEIINTMMLTCVSMDDEMLFPPHHTFFSVHRDVLIRSLETTVLHGGYLQWGEPRMPGICLYEYSSAIPSYIYSDAKIQYRESVVHASEQVTVYNGVVGSLALECIPGVGPLTRMIITAVLSLVRAGKSFFLFRDHHALVSDVCTILTSRYDTHVGTILDTKTVHTTESFYDYALVINNPLVVAQDASLLERIGARADKIALLVPTGCSYFDTYKK